MSLRYSEKTKKYILQNFYSEVDGVNCLQGAIKNFYDLRININGAKFSIYPKYSCFSNYNYVTLIGEFKLSDDYLCLNYNFIYKTKIFIPAIGVFLFGEFINIVIAIGNQINSLTIILSILFLFLPLVYCLAAYLTMKKEHKMINDFIKYFKSIV